VGHRQRRFHTPDAPVRPTVHGIGLLERHRSIVTSTQSLSKLYEALPEGDLKRTLRGLLRTLVATQDPVTVEFITSRMLQVLGNWRRVDPLERFQDAIVDLRRSARRSRKRYGD
jgi:hypothetical protein